MSVHYEIPVSAAEQTVARFIGAIPEVKYILSETTPQALQICIVVDEAPEEVRHRIFDKQLDVIAEFPSVDFDFNLIAGRNREPQEIASTAAVIYSRS